MVPVFILSHFLKTKVDLEGNKEVSYFSYLNLSLNSSTSELA